ncbi:hypothetical protein HOH45_02675 [bacterium]|jgi:uncharacterized protein|nr:hypothetical protein [bacterium]
MKYRQNSTRLVDMKSTILSKFKCHQTGACCRHSGYVRVNTLQVQKMASILKTDIVSFLRKFTIKKNGWTLIATPNFRPSCFLDETNSCTVYEGRPSSCKSYPDWPTIWESDETLLKEAVLCKGLDYALKKVTIQNKR